MRAAMPVSLLLMAACALAGESLNPSQSMPVAGNLLRNGSFEGSLKYWLRGLDNKAALVDGDATTGSHCLYLPPGNYIWSAPFVLEPGARVTVSCDLKGTADDAQFHFFLVPTCRSAGKEPFKIFWGKSGHGTKVDWKEWKRMSWDVAIPDAKTLDYRTWWDGRTWMLVPTGQHIRIDSLSIILGEKKDVFTTFSPVEVTELAVNLPAWKETCRILEKGFEAELETSIFNPSDARLDAKVIWQLIDFTGSHVLAELGTQSLALAPKTTQTLKHKAKLSTNGTVLARASVVGADGKLLGRSDQPLTTLPFPKNATKPDWKERFGGGVAAGNPYPTPLLGAAQKIGFGWSRWYPHVNWERCQPKSGEAWDWPDEIVNATLNAGISINAVLYAKPKWAFDEKKSKHLPVDMADWGPDDKRWDDLSVVTSWDRYVTEVVKHYADKSIAWEVVNEPEWDRWDPKVYFQFVKRTYQLIKKVNPKAVVMIDGCYGIDGLHRKFLEFGGAKFCDVFTFHNYSLGEFYSGDGISGIRQALDMAGGKHVEIWFNEGWTHFPSSEDYACQTLWADRTPERVVNGTIRTTAETFAAGMEKFIMFQLGYDHQGRSWWDWDGDGTVLYDDCHQPMAVVPVFNVLADQLGLSKHVASIRADGATFHVFQDQRHNRGVAVAWAERDGASFELPFSGLISMDAMGNTTELAANAGKTILKFAKPWTPIYLFSKTSTAGDAFASALKPFERPNVVLSEGVYTIPSDWLQKGPQGNPYAYRDKPIWWLGRVYPPEPTKVENFRPYKTWIPAETKWFEAENSQGGNPAAGLGGGLRITVVTEWQNGDKIKPSTLVFQAPEAAEYVVEAEAVSERWCGGGQCWLELYTLDRATGVATRLQERLAMDDRKAVAVNQKVTLAAGQELAFVYGADGWNTGAGLKFGKLILARADAKRPDKIQRADPNKMNADPTHTQK